MNNLTGKLVRGNITDPTPGANTNGVVVTGTVIIDDPRSLWLKVSSNGTTYNVRRSSVSVVRQRITRRMAATNELGYLYGLPVTRKG